MATEEKPKPDPSITLASLNTGSKLERLQAKSDFITKYGFSAYEQMILRSVGR